MHWWIVSGIKKPRVKKNKTNKNKQKIQRTGATEECEDKRRIEEFKRPNATRVEDKSGDPAMLTNNGLTDKYLCLTSDCAL